MDNQYKNISDTECAPSEAASTANETPMQRLRQFVKYLQSERLCKSESDFERMCGLSLRYIANNANTGKGDISTRILGRIIRVFPQLNLVWICNGDGSMVVSPECKTNIDYKQAYESAMSLVEVLNKMITK